MGGRLRFFWRFSQRAAVAGQDRSNELIDPVVVPKGTSGDGGTASRSQMIGSPALSQRA